MLKGSIHETATHLLFAITGSEACKTVEESVKRSLDADVMWSTSDNDRETSFVRCAQVHCDRPEPYLSLSAVVFYPLELALLNFFKH